MMNYTGKISIALLTAAITTSVYSQSLPSVQKGSVRIADIKIDGVPTETDGQFKAYSKATDVYYTIANDDDNLYLVVQAKYSDICDKILRGGITLTINQPKNKIGKEYTAVTYPVLFGTDVAELTNMFARKVTDEKGKAAVDVEINDLNKAFETKSTLIKLMPDKVNSGSELSLTNDEGIRAAAKFNKQLTYTYELSIPIKFLALSINGNSKFNYNIKINAETEKNMAHSSGPPPPMSVATTASTDLSGEYTLTAK